MPDTGYNGIIRTARLDLITMAPDLLRAEQRSYAELGRELGAEIAPEWPPEHWEPHVFDFIQKQYSDDPTTLGWNRYVVLRRAGRLPILIGTNGAFRRSDSEAEMGYSLVPGFQGKGYASESAAALMDWLYSECAVKMISAQTFPTLTASLRVMQRCGMIPAEDGDEPDAVRYQRQNPAEAR